MQRALSAAAALACASVGLGLSACGGGSSGGSGDFCQQAASTVQKFQALGTQLNGTSTPSVSTIKSVISQADQSFDSLDSNAPSAIASDFHTLRTAFDSANGSVQNANSYDGIVTAFSSLNSTNVQSASTHVDNYLKQTCGINPNATPS